MPIYGFLALCAASAILVFRAHPLGAIGLLVCIAWLAHVAGRSHGEGAPSALPARPVRTRDSAHFYAVFGYAVVAIAFTWPLPIHLSTHFTGSVGGDTGVYAWNLWVFRHELVEHGRLPFFTGTILSLTSPQTDLSLHNYTTFANVLALPLLPLLGLPATFNLIYLGMMVLTASAMFLLARRLTGTAAEAWLAGLLFAFSPMMSARGTGHFSLIAAAPLPIFLLLLKKTEQTRQARWAILTGATIAWAVLCDVYYGVYCVLLGGLWMGARLVELRPAERQRPAPAPMTTWVLNFFILCMSGLVLGILIRGGGRLQILGALVSIRHLYTPVLLLTLLVFFRLLVHLSRRLHVLAPYQPVTAARLLALAVIACTLVLSPMLYAFTARLQEGAHVKPKVFWRSSAPGIDAMALILPNPNHRLFGAAGREWLAQRPNGFAENVASIPLVALGVFAWAFWRGWKPSRRWVFFTLVFAALALGPFIRVAGINTYVPTPWALLRYAPLIGDARMPSRMTVLVMMGVAVLFAWGLQAVTRQLPAWRRPILWAVGLALAFELIPAPRRLYSAAIPSIYQTIAADPRDVSVLQLPFGVKDGTYETGRFNTASQYFQTYHGKRLIGGYLSRISQRRIKAYHRRPTLFTLLMLSQGRELEPFRAEAVIRRGPSFVERANLGYVVIDRAHATPALVRFAMEAFELEKIGESDGRELYRTRLR